MHVSRELAVYLRGLDGINGIPTDEDIARMAKRAGLVIDEDQPFRGRVREIYVSGHVAVRKGTERTWRRWLILHALGHHICHTGNSIAECRFDNGRWWAQHRKRERNAELIAGWTIFGNLPDRDPLGFGMTPALVAEWGEVPEECVRRWWEFLEESARENLDTVQRLRAI